MRGNSHVRFSGEGAAEKPPPYPTYRYQDGMSAFNPAPFPSALVRRDQSQGLRCCPLCARLRQYGTGNRGLKWKESDDVGCSSRRDQCVVAYQF